MFEFTPPALDAEEEPVDSPFYGLPVLPIMLPAKSIADGVRGRYCRKSGVFVPRSRLKFFNGLPHLDKLCPTEPEPCPDPLQGVTN